MDDLIFYEAAMEKRDNDAYLVIGNQKPEDEEKIRAFCRALK